MAKAAAARRLAAQNRKARHDFLIQGTIETGIMLTGPEVKSLRSGQANIQEAYAGEQGGELFLFNSYIPEYKAAARFAQQVPRRPRKLLVHKKELDRLLGAVKREGISLVPLSIYFNARGIAKVELGLGKGKRKQDKREAEKERQWQRDRSRLLRDKG